MNHQTLTLQNKVQLIMQLIVNLLPELDQDDHWHTRVSGSKVLCIDVIAFLDNNQNHSKTLLEFQKHGLGEYVLNEGQFNRRIQRLTEYIPQLVEKIALLAQAGLPEFPLKQIEKDILISPTIAPSNSFHKYSKILHFKLHFALPLPGSLRE